MPRWWPFRDREATQSSVHGELARAVEARTDNDDALATAVRANPQAALSVPAVFRAVDMLAGAIADLPIRAWRGDERLADTPTVLRQPDPTRPLSEWLYESVVSLLVQGDTLWTRRLVDEAGRASVLVLEDPTQWSVEFRAPDTRERVYRRMGVEQDPRFVTHTRYLSQPWRADGLSPIEACAATVASLIAAETMQSRSFQTGGVPIGVLTVPNRLPPETLAELRDEWHRTHGGSRSTAVLAEGVTYDAISASFRDAQLAELQDQGVAQVARMFGIPDRLLLAASPSGTSLTYANVSQVRREFLTFAVQPLLERLETSLTRELPRGQAARFDTAGFVRLSTRERYETYALGVQGGWLTTDDVRTAEGLDANPAEFLGSTA